MNIIQTIINILIALFTGKKVEANKPKVKPAPKPEPKPEPVSIPDPIIEKPALPLAGETLPLTEAITKTVIALGAHDAGVDPTYTEHMLKLFHRNIPGVKSSVKQNQMRNGDLFDWVPLKEVAGQPVKTLQTFLVNTGIMPTWSDRQGLFGYTTQAGVRLFQEYCRIYEGHTSMIPDGVVGPTTWGIMKQWQEEGKTVIDRWPRGQRSPEYNKWMKILHAAKRKYEESPNIILQQVNAKVEELDPNNEGKVDTRKVADWSFNENEIHLIGIRRKEEQAGAGRVNDDVFLLLINGLVFKFWGSTDPNQKENRRKDEAFLVEGQHKFRFGWHNVSSGRTAKLYQGLNPFDCGVLVFRDSVGGDNKLTMADVENKVYGPNTTINIHWTGIGMTMDGAKKATWSEGCQVIAGFSYMDTENTKIDCSHFSANGSADIQANKGNRIRKTKGAYNVFTDLLLLFSNPNTDYLIYTLGRDETLSHNFLTDLGGKDLLDGTVDEFGIRGLS